MKAVFKSSISRVILSLFLIPFIPFIKNVGQVVCSSGPCPSPKFYAPVQASTVYHGPNDEVSILILVVGLTVAYVVVSIFVYFSERITGQT